MTPRRRPDSQQVSLLLSALLRNSVRVDQFDQSTFARVAAVADSVGLAPALWAHGERAGWWHRVPPDAARIVRNHADGPYGQPVLALQDAFDRNRRRIADLLDQAVQLERAFAHEAIACVPLKGWHTIRAGWWTEPAERTMTDLDVLVAERDARRAADVLVQLGYVPINSGHTEFADHELPPVHLVGRAGSVEIHTALTVSRWAAVLPAIDVLAAGAPMSTTDAVTHLIAHAQLHDEGYLLAETALRPLFELAVLTAGTLGGDIDWPDVRAKFDTVNATAALDGFLWLSKTLFGAEVPLGRWRPRPRARLARLVLDRPRAASAVARAAYLPRAMGRERMRVAYPDQAVWRSRAKWALGRVRAGAVARRETP